MANKVYSNDPQATIKQRRKNREKARRKAYGKGDTSLSEYLTEDIRNLKIQNCIIILVLSVTVITNFNLFL